MTVWWWQLHLHLILRRCFLDYQENIVIRINNKNRIVRLNIYNNVAVGRSLTATLWVTHSPAMQPYHTHLRKHSRLHVNLYISMFTYSLYFLIYFPFGSFPRIFRALQHNLQWDNELIHFIYLSAIFAWFHGIEIYFTVIVLIFCNRIV